VKLNKTGDVLHVVTASASNYIGSLRSSYLCFSLTRWHLNKNTFNEKFLSLSFFHLGSEPRWKFPKTRTGERYDRRSL